MSHQRNESTLSNGTGGSGSGSRYKAITRELLMSICKKHFTLRAVGASISGSTRDAKSTLKVGSHHGDDYLVGGGFHTRTETLDHYLKRATHLQLDHLKLTHTHVVPELAQANGLTPNDYTFAQAKVCRVLYLHDNSLTTFDNFNFCKGALTHLYLQNNSITSMTNLVELQCLEKLYLSHNKIRVLEGFAIEDFQTPTQAPPQAAQPADADNDPAAASSSSSHPPQQSAPAPFYLVELHMDSQRLPAGVGLQLSIPSIQALSQSLTILSLASNQMDADSILPISLLMRLTHLNLSHNCIDDVNLVSEVCSYLPELTNLDLRGNPINTGPNVTAVVQKTYRDKIIMASRAITLLDDKAVPDNQRDYLHSLRQQKRLKRAAAAAAAGQSQPTMSPEEARLSALHSAPKFAYQPKVLTLRTTPLPGTISAGAVGAFGAGYNHTQTSSGQHANTAGAGAHAGNYAPYVPSYQTQSSPFLDDDPNLMGGGDDGDGSSDPLSSHLDGLSLQPAASSSSSSLVESDPIPNGPFTGSTARLDYLLQSRGLVSALTTPTESNDDPAAQVESARNRRATMNTRNQRAWDGGRTAYIPTNTRTATNVGSKPRQTSSAGTKSAK